ncbi:hypothetical protein T265_12024, partial [Opisthorchis viverrini]
WKNSLTGITGQIRALSAKAREFWVLTTAADTLRRFQDLPSACEANCSTRCKSAQPGGYDTQNKSGQPMPRSRPQDRLCTLYLQSCTNNC